MIKRFAAFGVAALLLVTAACSSGDDNSQQVETDPDATEFDAAYFSAAVDRTAAESFNYSMTMDLDMSVMGQDISADDVAFSTGTVSGDMAHTLVDMGAMFDAMGVPSGMFGSDLTMETIVDGDRALYLRAPYFQTLADMGQTQFQGFADLGAGWGRVDPSLAGDATADELTRQLAQGTVGFGPMLEVVRNAENAEDLGTEQINGSEATGLRAELVLTDLLDATGQDLGAVYQAQGMPADEAEKMIDAFAKTVTPITVWIDDEGRVVRIEVAMDLGAAVAELAAEDLPEGADDLQMRFGYVIDAFDFGAPDAIEIPTEWTDVTDAYAAMSGIG